MVTQTERIAALETAVRELQSSQDFYSGVAAWAAVASVVLPVLTACVSFWWSKRSARNAELEKRITLRPGPVSLYDPGGRPVVVLVDVGDTHDPLFVRVQKLADSGVMLEGSPNTSMTYELLKASAPKVLDLPLRPAREDHQRYAEFWLIAPYRTELLITVLRSQVLGRQPPFARLKTWISTSV